jgi:membrane protein DedA with SNARE-associated domain
MKTYMMSSSDYLQANVSVITAEITRLMQPYIPIYRFLGLAVQRPDNAVHPKVTFSTVTKMLKTCIWIWIGRLIKRNFQLKILMFNLDYTKQRIILKNWPRTTDSSSLHQPIKHLCLCSFEGLE